MNFHKFSRCHRDMRVEWRVVGPLTASKGTLRISRVFYFAETRWRLELLFGPDEQPEKEKLTFMFLEPCKYNVSYSFSLRNPNGALELLSAGFLESNQKDFEHHYLKLQQTLPQRPEFASAEFIVIEGSMQAGYVQESNVDPIEPPFKKLKRLDDLSSNFERLFNDQLSCDVSVLVKDKKYQLHKAVLIARSPVFAAMFQHDTSEKQTGIINVSDCDPESFQKFLKFLYCGMLEELTYSSALNLYVTSKKYNVEELNTFCRLNLIDKLGLNTWCDVYLMGDLYEDKKLKTACQEFFNSHLLQIFKTSEWRNFMKDNHELACNLLKEIPAHKIVK